MSRYTIERARAFLTAYEIFFDNDFEEDDARLLQTINLNDAFYWACSDCQYVEDEELPRLAELVSRYGWCGLEYWVVVEKRGEERVEFENVNRSIEFVRREEAAILEEPSASKRAYKKIEYTIGCKE